jgi:hypothetical protein
MIKADGERLTIEDIRRAAKFCPEKIAWNPHVLDEEASAAVRGSASLNEALMNFYEWQQDRWCKIVYVLVPELFTTSHHNIIGGGVNAVKHPKGTMATCCCSACHQVRRHFFRFKLNSI